MMMNIRPGSPGDMPALTVVWRRSVEATHAFLTTADIAALEPQVAQGLAGLELWVAEVDGELAGFMAMRGNMIEALFIDPKHKGRGLGTRFVGHARELRGRDSEIWVDVNEQNPQAVGFYLAKGFRRAGRSATDSAGRPWPLLHLVLPPALSARE